MENSEQPNQKKSNNLFFMILSGVLTLVSLFLAYQLYNQKTLTETVIVEKEKIDSIYVGVKSDLDEVQKLYDGLQTNNKQLQSELDIKREEIEELGVQLEKYKGDAEVVRKLQKELKTIRNLIKSYLHEIDLLQIANQGLKDSNLVVNQSLIIEKGKTEQLNNDKKNLSEKLDVAAKLTAYQLFADAVKMKGEAKEITTTRAARADKIRACFTLSANRIANQGEKIIYMKITSPNGQVLVNGTDDSNSFTAYGQKQSFSSKRGVEYEGSAKEVCMGFIKKEEFAKGKYKVEIFADGVSIGDAEMELK